MLDWSSTDGLLPYRHPLVKWKRVDGQKFIYTSKCKNAAHAMASGEHVCNLDADNWVGEDWLRFICAHLRPDAVLWPGRASGCWGRVVLPVALFRKLGGYDEGMIGWGYDDVDLIERSRASGASIIETGNSDFLPHDDGLRTECHGPCYRNKERSDRNNELRSKKRIAEGKLDWRIK